MTTKAKQHEDKSEEEVADIDETEFLAYVGRSASREFSAADLSNLDNAYTGEDVSFNRDGRFCVKASALTPAIVEHLLTDGDFKLGSQLTQEDVNHIVDKLTLADNNRVIRI